MARWFRRTVLAIVAVLVVALSGVMPAAAGGPTSVLLSAPSVPRVVATGYEDKAYNDLTELIRSTDAGGKADTSHQHESGEFIRATWLIHDMSVWRLDVIYPQAENGPWIATTVMDENGKLPEMPVWHRSADPAKMLKLLDALGLLGGKHGESGPTNLSWNDGTQTTTAPAEQPVVQQPVVQQPVETVKAQPGTLTGWRWAIPGFVLGAIIAVVAVRLLRAPSAGAGLPIVGPL
jgi:hypothetical protein